MITIVSILKKNVDFLKKYDYNVIIKDYYSNHLVITIGRYLKNMGTIEEKEREFEEQKKNGNFVMMYRDHMPEMRWLMKKSGIASGILNFIMEHMDSKNALCCSYIVFMDYFEVSKPTITRAIKLLYDNGFIDILKSGTSNVYIVNKEISWTSWNNQKEYCQFNGNILVSKSENKDYFYRNQYDRFKELKEREGIK